MIVLTLVACTMTTGQALARTLSFATNSPPNSKGLVEGLKWWAQQVEERSGGDLKVNIYYLQSLVKLKNAVEGISSGVATAGIVVPAYSQSRMPLHYLATTDFGSADPYVTAEAWYRLYNKLPSLQAELDKNNLVYLSNNSVGPTVLISNGHPYLTPKDLDGQKVRLSSHWTRTANHFGWDVTTVSMTFPDIYSALQRGTIDGAVSYLGLIIPARHNEVISYVVEPRLGQQANMVVMNRNVFESLPKKDQKVLMDLRHEWLLKDAEHTINHLNDSRRKLENNQGHPIKVIKLDEKQRQTWEPGLRWSDDETVKQMMKYDDHADAVYKAYLDEIKVVEEEVKKNGYPWEH